MATQSSGELPIGATVENAKPASIPTKKSYAGEFVKNRNRDTAWFTMIDKDWADIKINMEKWLYAAESDSSLSGLKSEIAFSYL